MYKRHMVVQNIWGNMPSTRYPTAIQIGASFVITCAAFCNLTFITLVISLKWRFGCHPFRNLRIWWAHVHSSSLPWKVYRRISLMIDRPSNNKVNPFSFHMSLIGCNSPSMWACLLELITACCKMEVHSKKLDYLRTCPAFLFFGSNPSIIDE